MHLSARSTTITTNKADLREELNRGAKTGKEDRVALRRGKHFERGMRIIGERRTGVSAALRLE